jgi:hypothetical protein
MITSTEAVRVLINQCKGVYTPRTYSTIERTFKPSYTNDVAGFNYDQQLNDKILMPYVPHEWINE